VCPIGRRSSFREVGPPLDEIDLRLVEELRHNARTPFAVLARRVELSPPAVHERITKLEQNCVIRAYRAEVAPEPIGLGITALIGLQEVAAPDSEALIEALDAMEEVETCYFVAGEESFLIKVRAATMLDLEHLVVRLSRVPGVARTRTTVVISTKWENRPPPSPTARQLASPEPAAAGRRRDGARRAQ
jgi:Lrp/AsnC family transcriptional regulator, leucine-responsive regulatory protein